MESNNNGLSEFLNDVRMLIKVKYPHINFTLFASDKKNASFMTTRGRKLIEDDMNLLYSIFRNDLNVTQDFAKVISKVVNETTMKEDLSDDYIENILGSYIKEGLGNLRKEPKEKVINFENMSESEINDYIIDAYKNGLLEQGEDPYLKLGIKRMNQRSNQKKE